MSRTGRACVLLSLLAVQTALASRIRLLQLGQPGALTSFPQSQEAVDNAQAAAAAATQEMQEMLAKYVDPQLLSSRLQASQLDSTSPPSSADPSPSSKPQPSPSPSPVTSTPKQPASTTEQPESAGTQETEPQGATEPAEADSNSLKDNVLSVHNTLRAKHQASPLGWSSELAAGAQSWASGCVWGHSDAEEGENLAIGYSSIEKAMQVWANEEKRYQYGEVTPNMDHFEEVGHFTQMVWKSTTHIGCATAQCTWKGRDATYLVCRYDPAGNVLGQFADNVKPPSD